MRSILLLMGLGVVAQAHDVISTKITFTKEVSRVLYARCTSCHREGGSSFSLVNYSEARPWAKAIKEEVLARRMPPWNAVKGFGEFRNDQGLTQEQIETLADWVEGGAPEGDPAYLPPMTRQAAAAVPKTSAKIAVKGSLVLEAPVRIAGIQPGALPKGGALQVIATHPDGRIEPMLWVQAFNPTYKQPYWYKSALSFPAGTKIQVAPPSGAASLLVQ